MNAWGALLVPGELFGNHWGNITNGHNALAAIKAAK